MRYLDLAIAALIGVSAISGIAAYSPKSGDEASRSLVLESELRDQLITILQQKGTPWLVQSGPAAICDYLGGLSNSSFTFSGTVGSFRCAPSPPTVYSVATLVLELVPYRVVLEAWPGAAG